MKRLDKLGKVKWIFLNKIIEILIFVQLKNYSLKSQKEFSKMK